MRRVAAFVVLFFVSCTAAVRAQSTNASVTGRVTDPAKALIVGANVTAINAGTNVRYEGSTNGAGDYYVTSLPPGTYRIEVEKPGFKTVIKPDLILHVQDALEINFEMTLGSASETVTVEAANLNINTTDASVSTVIDRQFVENMPLNGRTFQNLIALTPGVVLSVPYGQQPGEFSVNGQRSSANYFSVDGVSANIGVNFESQFAGSSIAGAQPGLTANGGFNSLVSIDDLEEFRVETSSYAPEFGRTPGGQIELRTRSGTNEIHGDIFEYFRNDVLDANDWFADADSLPKPAERQNDFGGTIGGPVVLPIYDGRNQTFFFFSYEGLRLRQPEVIQSEVPALSIRQLAAPAAAVYFNAFPIPTGPEYTDSSGNGTGWAPFNSSFSIPSTLNSTSLRIDHHVGKAVQLFGRYSYAPSSIEQRAANSLSSPQFISVSTSTLTLGATFLVSPRLVDEFRFNYSTNQYSSRFMPDTFGGAVPPPDSVLFPFPASVPITNASSAVFISYNGPNASLDSGTSTYTRQKQLNIINSLHLSWGSHQVSFGMDYRRLAPSIGQPNAFGVFSSFFGSVPNIQQGIASFASITNTVNFHPIYSNLGVYAQDSWRISSRLNLTYGFRWEFNPPPTDSNGLRPITVTGLDSPADYEFNPPGTSLYKTTYRNFAPRAGLAYQLFTRPKYETALRAGFGLFYDLGSNTASQAFAPYFPFQAQNSYSNLTLPLSEAQVVIPPVTPNPQPPYPPFSSFVAFEPGFSLPRTYQWNVALEQSVGSDQAISISYVGSAGRELLNQLSVFNPNAALSNDTVTVNQNRATSDYDALQMQFKRRLSHGLQVLASYTWSHSIDLVSDELFYGTLARASSDFDLRHTFSAAVAYNLPQPKGAVARAFGGGWSLDGMVFARSAPPVDLNSGTLVLSNGQQLSARPDVVPGIPLYLYGPEFPGNKAINPNAFVSPPVDSNGNYARQGDWPRNALRGFGATQVDFAVRRDFAIFEHLHLQAKVEAFNLLNHPNFGPPNNGVGCCSFGQSTSTLATSLSGGDGSGLNALYSIGGPRSLQLSLKLIF